LLALSQQRSTIELLAKIAAFLHEARAMELQNAREERDREAKTEFGEALGRLEDDELEMFMYLQHTMGYADAEEWPDDWKEPPKAWRPGAKRDWHEPAPEPEPEPPKPTPKTRKYPPAPPPKKPILSRSNGHSEPIIEYVGDNPPETGDVVDAEPEDEAKTIPPAPTKAIPGKTTGVNLIHRHLLVRAASRPQGRPISRRGPDPLPFPGDDK
jgi:hypothetical protein